MRNPAAPPRLRVRVFAESPRCLSASRRRAAPDTHRLLRRSPPGALLWQWRRRLEPDAHCRSPPARRARQGGVGKMIIVLALPPNARNRVPVRERLSVHSKIGRYARDRRITAERMAETGLHLIENQNQTIAVGQFAQSV